MKWHEKIIQAHMLVTDEVSHSQRLKSERYFVWQEDGTKDFVANEKHVEHAVTGTTDLFTKQEFDPWMKELGEALSSLGIAWRLNSVQYENETGFYHIEWAWEVCDGAVCI